MQIDTWLILFGSVAVFPLVSVLLFSLFKRDWTLPLALMRYEEVQYGISLRLHYWVVLLVSIGGIVGATLFLQR